MEAELESERVHDEIERLKQLRAEERKVLELSIYQGLSQSQIAKQTDLPLGTVKTHARRGLIRLRELLGEQRSEIVQGDAK